MHANWWIRQSLKPEMFHHSLKSCSLWNNSHLHITSCSLSYQCGCQLNKYAHNLQFLKSKNDFMCTWCKQISNEKELVVVFFFKSVLFKTLYKGNLYNSTRKTHYEHYSVTFEMADKSCLIKSVLLYYTENTNSSSIKWNRSGHMCQSDCTQGWTVPW